ncbi:MAG: hypothetical protein K0R54_1707 [Clostridiaceae bacterium]|jgi:hypothetical protein|nr:hypothetical protein [Clostridiaceae bacterium]
MSKIMSVFEKLNLVEKVDNNSYQTNSISKNDSEEDNQPVELEHHIDEYNTNPPEPIKEDVQAIDAENLDRNMSIEDIYARFGMNGSSINTVFMLEKFIDALPENLPLDIKRQSVINILKASDTNLNMLISDGEKRLNILNTFAKDYYNSTTQAIVNYKSEIEKLNALINNYREQIQLKESMLSEQNNVVKYETEKINNTINFFKNND